MEAMNGGAKCSPYRRRRPKARAWRMEMDAESRGAARAATTDDTRATVRRRRRNQEERERKSPDGYLL